MIYTYIIYIYLFIYLFIYDIYIYIYMYMHYIRICLYFNTLVVLFHSCWGGIVFATLVPHPVRRKLSACIPGTEVIAQGKAPFTID